MDVPNCPRCDGGEETYWIKRKLSQQDRGPKFFIEDEAGRWWICQDCGLVWIPKTGRRNRTVEITY